MEPPHAIRTPQPRLAGPPRSLYVSGGCEIDLARRELRIEGTAVPVGDRAFSIIELLAQSAGEMVTKREITARIWPGAVVPENTVRVHTAALRKAFGKHRGLLKTEAGRGYCLLGNWTIGGEHLVGSPPAPQALGTTGVAPAGNLPALQTHLVGRDALLQRLTRLMSASSVVTVTGPGGIGKTALALAAAHAIRTEFADGTWLVELASLSDPGLVPSAVVQSLGLKLGGERISDQAVARAIGERQLLLIFDNCEHVIEAVAMLVDTLTRRCARITVLATSREILQISGEYICRVPPLDVPEPGEQDANELLQYTSIALFVARGQILGSDFFGDGAALPTIAAICRRLDGIPLAIEFAASAAAALGTETVAEGLRDRFSLLTRGRRTASARHRTLRAALDWSHDLLPEPEQYLLRRLAVFPAAFSLDEAAAVMCGTCLDRSAVADGIGNLVAKSLVALDQSESPTRWRLLETVRAYALEKLAQHDEIPYAANHRALLDTLAAP